MVRRGSAKPLSPGSNPGAASNSPVNSSNAASGVTIMNKTSVKYLEARESLPEELRPIYDPLVDEYLFHTGVSYGRGYVAYRVLAALVRDGWRPPDERPSPPPSG